ncbi:hypothetical protein ACVWW4_004008 [Bradyrhizobium sp. LB7.1]
MASKVLAHATALLNDLVTVGIRQELMVRVINRLEPLLTADGRPLGNKLRWIAEQSLPIIGLACAYSAN